jgi:hypothetical protein
MQLDPKKLQALAKQQSMSAPNPAPKGRGQAMSRDATPDDVNDHDDDDNSNDDNDSDDNDDTNSVLDDLGEFAAALRSAAHELEEIIEKLGVADDGTITDENPGPSPATRAKVRQSITQMPSSLRAGFKQYIKGKSWDDTQAIADKLADEGKIDDPDAFAGWLHWASKSV